MIKIFVVLCFCLLSLEARENPFFPSEGEIDTPLTANQKLDLSPLQRATLSLPSTARVIKSVTVSYKNLDGSIEKKSIELHNSVDWHLPIFISQSYTSPFDDVKSEKKLFKEIVKLKFTELLEGKRELKLLTKDKILRNFLLTKPHRIVCDFSRDISIRSYEKKIKDKSSVITKVRIGNHEGYYRVVIELDGYYRYALKKIDGGYLFTFL